MLLQSLAHAENKSRTRWDYAVPLQDVTKTGILASDLRGLIDDGVLEHGHENLVCKSEGREFDHDGEFVFNATSCFVLSDRGVNLAKSLVGVDDLAQMLISYADQLAKMDLPRWDATRRELWVGVELVKRFDGRANQQEAVLQAFEDHQWCECLDSPLKNPSRHGSTKLRTVVQNLNRNQIVNRIKFRSTSRGKKISWELLSPPSDR
jgi:hypothetical protein